MEKEINLKNFFLSNKNIKIQTIAYSLNLFLPTFILLISSFFKNYNLTAELGILIGINIIFTQIFSSNARSILISKKATDPIFSYLVFRIIVSIIIIITNIITFYFFDFSNNFVLTQISIMIILQWINELMLTFFELNKKIKEFYFYNIFGFLFIFLILVVFFYSQDLFYIFFGYNLFLFLFLFLSFLKIKKNKINLKKILLYALTSKAFFSSFSISFANLIWRFFIIYFCGKILAGVYFASFALGSLPGTLFNNTFGPSIVKKNFQFGNSIKIFLIPFYIIFFCLLIFLIFNKSLIFIDLAYTQVFGTALSLLGSIIMVKSQYLRQYIILKTSQQSQLFKTDIIYSILIITIVPMLYFLGGEKFIVVSFLISSAIAYITYNLIFFRNYRK